MVIALSVENVPAGNAGPPVTSTGRYRHVNEAAHCRCSRSPTSPEQPDPVAYEIVYETQKGSEQPPRQRVDQTQARPLHRVESDVTFKI